MSIFIFEDDMIQANSLKKMVEEIFLEESIPYDFIETTSKYEEIIEKIPFCKEKAIYFLDIEIKEEEKKGLDVAKEIRKVDPNGIIVFITTHVELAPISYQYMVSALTFIDKNQPIEIKKLSIRKCLVYYREQNVQAELEDIFFVENAYTSLKIPFHTIEYFCTDEPHRLKLVATNQFVQFYGTLKELEEKDARLIRCHQSFLVNRDKIQSIDLTMQELILYSGKRIPVSRRMMKSMKALIKEN